MRRGIRRTLPGGPTMFLVGLSTAVPPRSFTQAQCWEALQRAERPELTPRTRAILQGILTHDNGIERRSLALDSLDEGFELDPDTLHRRFARHAPALAPGAAAAPQRRRGGEHVPRIAVPGPHHLRGRRARPARRGLAGRSRGPGLRGG